MTDTPIREGPGIGSLRLIDPREIERNPENPRLIFHEDELKALEASIEDQGVLVPLTVFRDNTRLFLLDGERRWRCAVRLGLTRVPVIIQPKPDRMQNIMMMFAIHNARRDWDPLPTAYKLQDLEAEFKQRNGREPNEIELAELASLPRGTVRRLKQLLELPEKYRSELMEELEKPRSEQVITVDHVLETTRGAAALRKRDVIRPDEEDDLRQAILTKFRTRVERNTVAPRQLAKLARAVERNEIPQALARSAATRLITDQQFTIDDAFNATAAQVHFEHNLEQSASRLQANLEAHRQRGYELGEGLNTALRSLLTVIRELLGT